MTDTEWGHGEYYILVGGHRIEKAGNHWPSPSHHVAGPHPRHTEAPSTLPPRRFHSDLLTYGARASTITQ